MIINQIHKEQDLEHKMNTIVTKQSQLSKRSFTNTIYKNEIIIFSIINIILFLIAVYLMIKNK